MKLKNGIVAFLTVLLATDCLARAIFEEIRPLVARNRFRSKSDRALSLSFKNVEEETSNPSGGHEEVKPVAEKILVREDIHQSQGSESDHHHAHPNTVQTVSEDNPPSHPEQHVNHELKPITGESLAKETESAHSGHQSQGSESDQAHRIDSNTVQTVSESNPPSNQPAEELKSSKVLVDQTEDPNHSSSKSNLESHNIKPDFQANPIQSEANEKSEPTQNSNPVQQESLLIHVDNQHDKESQTQETVNHHDAHEQIKDEPVVKEVNQTIQFNDKPSLRSYLIEYYDILAKAASLSPAKSEENTKGEIKLSESDILVQDLHPEKEHKVNVDSSSVVQSLASALESESVQVPKMEETHQPQFKAEVVTPKEDEIAILETQPEKVANQEAKVDHKFVKVVEEVIERAPEQHFDRVDTIQNANEKEGLASQNLGQVYAVEGNIREDTNHESKESSSQTQKTISDDVVPVEKAETQLQEVKPAEDQTRQSEISVDQIKVQETPSQSDHAINVEKMETLEPVIKIEEQNNLDEKPKEQITSEVTVHNNEISADKPCSAQLTEETNHRMSELFEIKIYVNKKLIRLGV